VQGGTVRICYDFDGSGLTQTRLTVTFTPGNQTAEYTVTEANPCVNVTVPANATSILVHDVDGTSPDQAAAIDT
jgi:hypothetical protein